MKNSPIHIVSTFHYDVLYLKDYDEYLAQGLAIIDRALDLLETEADYRFTVEQVILAREYYERFPARREAMHEHAQSGRLEFAPGMFVMPDMNMIDGESLFLQAKFGKAWLRETLGVEADACWIADCWGHHAQLPQILRQSGYRSYFFWRCMRRGVARSDFFWKGLDGSRILTHWLSHGYSGVHFPDRRSSVDNVLEQKISDASAEAITALAGKIRSYGDNGATLISNGGDFCVPQAGAPEAVRKLGSKFDLSFSTPAAYSAAVDQSRLETFDGEFNAAFQGTYSTNIALKQLLWKRREQLIAEEGYRALHGIPAQNLTRAWETVLTHQFHDTICGTVTDSALERALRELEALQSGVSAPDSLYNPASHPRRETVELADGKRVLAELKPFETKPFQAFEPLPEFEPVPAGEGKFCNSFYRARFGANGFLASLQTPAGLELIDSASPARFGAPVMQNDYGDSWLLYEGPIDGGSMAAAFEANRPDPLERESGVDGLVNRKATYPAIESVEWFRAGGTLRVVQRGRLCFWRNRVEFTLTTECEKSSPLICYKLSILPQGKHFRLRAAFPATVGKGTVAHEIPFGIQRRGHSEFPAHGFCDCADDGAGLTLLNRGIPGNNVDGNGVMLLSLFRAAAMEYKCESERSFNNGVPHTFEYAVMPRDGESLDPVVIPAELYVRPVHPVAAAPEEYDFTGLELPGNVRVSALRESSGGIFLRLYEMLGKPAAFRLNPPKGLGMWRETDGLERPVSEPMPCPAELVMKPFEIRNLMLTK